MVTTEEMIKNLIVIGQKRDKDLNAFNSTLGTIKEVDESLALVNVKKKNEEQKLQNSTNELISALYQTCIVLLSEMSGLETKINELTNKKCSCHDSSTNESINVSEAIENHDELEDYAKEAVESM